MFSFFRYQGTELDRSVWDYKASSLQGYQDHYRLKANARLSEDKLYVDFAPISNLVRICLVPAEEPHKEYIAILKGGSILQEKEAFSRTSLRLGPRLKNFAPYFRRIPDPLLLASIGGNYGMPKNLQRLKRDSSLRMNLYKKVRPIHSLRAYLQAKTIKQEQLRTNWQSLCDRFSSELFDISLGGLAYWCYLQKYLSFTELALLLGFFGIWSGAWDWLWRRRAPFLPKVALFLGLSCSMLYMQIQYRMWAMYL